MSKYAYFPGCSLDSSAKEYAMSLRAVAELLDIELQEIPDWNCCGAGAAAVRDRLLPLALNARNLTLAAGIGRVIISPCALCQERLQETQRALQGNTELKGKIGEILGTDIQLDAGVISPLELFSERKLSGKLQLQVRKSLSGLRLVTYYGCRLPRSLSPQERENPGLMDRLLTDIGAEVLPWAFKAECCGGSLSMSDEGAAHLAVERILNMAKACRAEVIVTACPQCQNNLDIGQYRILELTGVKHDLPVVYFTQLLGLVLGVNEKVLGLDRHFVDPRPVLKKLGLV